MKKKRNKLQLMATFLIISSVFITLCLANTEDINLEEEVMNIEQEEVILIPEDTSNNSSTNSYIPTTPQIMEKTIRVDFMEGVNPKYELYALVTSRSDGTGLIEIRDANTNKLVRTIKRPSN